uniref:Uncharacterized AAA domain-containing protein ycf46 n=2 Tax=Porphyridium purpureum TaxID=35688 RepID=W0RYK7_PORPP|nr:conserved hypothetical plastid protein [Porphyridium purpureum]BAO23596.1 conserved hypothetical plastid protein [Porphyridium purpureum]
MHFTKELNLLLKSRYPIIYISTNEELRLEYNINQLLSDEDWNINIWDFVQGYYHNPNDNGKGKRNPLEALDHIDEQYNIYTKSFFILKDFDKFLSDIGISRKLKNLYNKLKLREDLIVSNQINIPEELREIIHVVSFPLPNKYEIREEVTQLSNAVNLTLTKEFIEKLVNLFEGFNLEKIRKLFITILAEEYKIKSNYNRIILLEKQQVINRTNILELCITDQYLNDVGGLYNLKQWLKLRKNSFSRKAELYGLPSPRGLMLIGIQGTGKTLTAKAIANEWELPLLKLDIGKLFGGIVGESESNIREMIKIAEAMAPCIIWIDEIDKAFTGIYSQGDSGTTSRVFASLTTWLSEKVSKVFIVATANNIEFLPPELIRKGRFDEIFFVGLPSVIERIEIFKVLLKKVRPNTYLDYDIKYLSKISENFSGAEIEQVVIESMYVAYKYQRYQFLTDDIVNIIKGFIPLAYSNQNEINKLQNLVDSGKISK